VIDRSGTANLTSTSTTYVDMDATNLKPRIECSGAPLRVTLNGTGAQNAANINVFFQLAFDGAAFANSEQFRSSAAATGREQHLGARLYLVHSLRDERHSLLQRQRIPSTLRHLQPGGDQMPGG
jgi:hypothetical protein